MKHLMNLAVALGLAGLLGGSPAYAVSQAPDEPFSSTDTAHPSGCSVFLQGSADFPKMALVCPDGSVHQTGMFVNICDNQHMAPIEAALLLCGAKAPGKLKKICLAVEAGVVVVQTLLCD